jgi:PAS domain S-box-containing protein
MNKKSNTRQFSEAHYQVAMEAAGLGMWYWDLLHNQQVWSKECRAILGISPDEEARYEYFLSLVHPDDREHVQALLSESHRTQKSYNLEYRIIWPDGSLHWIADRGSYFYDTQGIATRLVGVIWDITAQKRAEETRCELERKKDEFTCLASHELRTPLTSLKGNLQLAERFLRRCLDEAATSRSEREKTILDHLAVLNERALRQANIESRLVNDLLDANAVQAGALHIAPKKCDLARIARNTIDDMRAIAQTHPLSLALPAVSEIPVIADEVRIGQVVANYVKNALQYSDKQQPVTVGITLEENEARVWVKDAGPGLSMEAQRALWNRFHRPPGLTGYASPGNGGLGLGLYICQELIRLHRGHTGIESAIGQGSTFWFTLPLANS